MKEIYPRVHKFVAARLTPGEELGLHFTVGIALMLFAAWVFGGIAEEVVEAEEITLLDDWLARWFNARATPAFTQAMMYITHAHNTAGMLIMTTALGVYFYLRKAQYWLLALLVSVPGGMLLNVILKHIFQRARPSLENPLLTLTTYSFPSGHTVAATLFYGLIAAYLVCQSSRWKTRFLIVLGACVMVGLVGLSRMYLGVHYLTDVLAAIAEGCGWLAICITGVSTLRRRRAARATR
ncbi:phosphatase PAP2 family protein [Massilia sp. GCM10020059]|uniref:Phosphatase PAP2 family protein n=1 Tax=Massilia agrisoli TaxID=2892444 RepID=A0ABS8IXD7_9BURK|nr:phosphatase PAP2 family protein [Massilia agrisoli]MCC6072818.1 phosphatase PAP2 family protein [Massilia agrisoli]